MRDGQTVKIHGLDALERKLRELGAETGGKVLRGAMMTATKPLADAIKEAAPVRTFTDDEERPSWYTEGGKGTLKNAIGRRAGLYKGDKTARKFEETFASNQDTAAVIQVGAVKKGAWKAHFQEFGTENHAPQPFILPAFYAGSDEVLLRFRKSLASRITSAIRKLAQQR